jgi:hypothetical protein
MTTQEATNILGSVLYKYDGYWYSLQDKYHHDQLIDTIRTLLNQGADIHQKCSDGCMSPLLIALFQKHDKSILQELIKNGYEKTHELPYIDYVCDNTREYVIPRIHSIPNLLLLMYYSSIKDETINTKLINIYKECVGWKDAPITIKNNGTNTIVYKYENNISDTSVEDDDQSDDEQYISADIVRDNELIRKFIKKRLEEYCILFEIDMNSLTYIEEKYPDDFTRKYFS